jgi:hypothetical protein
MQRESAEKLGETFAAAIDENRRRSASSES